jgi:hypothetical protein
MYLMAGRYVEEDGVGQNFSSRLNPAEDAEFTLVNSSEEENKNVRNLPATLETVKFLRHPKAAAEPDYLKPLKDEIALDIELGLENQFSIDQRKILQKDIDTLTKSNNYYQITGKLLRRLFKMESLKSMCISHNIWEALIKTFFGLKTPLIIITIGVICWIAAVHIGPVACNLKSAYHAIANVSMAMLVISATLSLVLFIVSFATEAFGKIRFNFQFIGVELKMENIKETKITIPRMAKLKIKEAKDSDLFEEFRIAYPYFTVNREEYRPRRRTDPVILGVAKDNRWFMVCWWDVAKDIDMVQTHIDMFKKFKIS